MNTSSVLVMALALVGCASEGLRYDRSAPQTFDGLSKIENTRVDSAWVRERFDPSRYSKIMFVGKGIEYATVNPLSHSPINPIGNRFPISLAQKQQLEKIVREEFTAELNHVEAFEITTVPGPDVMIVSGGLIDVVSTVPPERAGQDEIYLEAVGEASLLIEFIDSTTNQAQLRAVDRQAAGSDAELDLSAPVTNWNDVRRVAQRWARMRREDLDELTTVAREPR